MSQKDIEEFLIEGKKYQLQKECTLRHPVGEGRELYELKPGDVLEYVGYVVEPWFPVYPTTYVFNWHDKRICFQDDYINDNCNEVLELKD